MRALEGKAIVVTGAARGLGAAYSLFLAREGASIVVNDIDAAACEETARTILGDAAVRDAGGTAVGAAGDVTIWATAETLVARCTGSFGRLDGFVNNAGVFYLANPEEDREEAFRRTIEVNVLGAAWCGLQALRVMKRQGFGSLVNVSSGAIAGLPARGAYGASKGALTSMSYAWAIDMKPFGVRVNAVSPLATTAMSEASDDYSRSKGGNPRRVEIDPMDNAPVVAFLLSDLAKDVTGQLIRTQNGEMSLLSPSAILLPSARRDNWTVEDVREVFVSDFAQRSFPPGLVSIKAERQARGR